MLGTIVNTGCIIVGSVVGSLLKKGLGQKYQQTLYNAMGLASLALGANTFVHTLRELRAAITSRSSTAESRIGTRQNFFGQ